MTSLAPTFKKKKKKRAKRCLVLLIQAHKKRRWLFYVCLVTLKLMLQKKCSFGLLICLRFERWYHFAQWETLCSKGRRKPLNVVLYQFFLHQLKDILFAVQHAKFCWNMLTGSMSKCKNKKPSYFVSPKEFVSSRPIKLNE